MTKVLISTQTNCLLAARAFKQLVSKVTGKSARIVTENAKFKLMIDKDLVNQAKITVTDTITIAANSEKNVFRAAMICLTLSATEKLKKGEHYFPLATKHRVLMVDMGRKYYSLTSLKMFVDEMALFQFNTLQLHFSENQGFRIESETHPEIVSKNYLTKKEILELISYANSRFIEIIPDFDGPGHLEHILENHPEWQLPMIQEDGTLGKAPRALDIFNETAVKYIQSIYVEYAVLFKNSRYFHIGADEFVPFDELEKYPTLKEYAVKKFGEDASGIEVFTEYVNKMITFVQGLGFVPMVWNDGFYRTNRDEKLTLSKECLISYWTRWDKNMAPVQKYIDEGYQVINHNDNFFYYVLGEHASYDYPTYEKIMDGWNPQLFASNQEVSLDYADQMWGTAVSIWADVPDAKTEREVNTDIFFILAAAMQKLDGVTVGDKEVVRRLMPHLFSLE